MSPKPILLLTLLTINFALAQNIDFNKTPNEVKLLGENFISTHINERDFALSPDGKEIYFTIATPQSTFQTIVCSKKDKSGKWSKPTIVSFAGKYSDLEPALSADGNRLYFASNRPISGDQPKDFDIWVVERINNSWGTPRNLGKIINTSADEFYPSIAKSGNLYFTAQYKDGIGKEDIFVAAWNKNEFVKPVPLDSTVNSTGYEFNAFVDADEQFILFTGYGRKDDTGRGDLYISVKGENGLWNKAKNLKAINSSKLDYCPFVSADKKILFFTSERAELPMNFKQATTYENIQKINLSTLNGTGNIYWISFEAVLKMLN